MSDPNDYAKCVASSEHIRTLAAMMQRDGIDITITTDETHGGIPFVAVVCQGQFAQLAEDWAKALALQTAALRKSAKDQAERG